MSGRALSAIFRHAHSRSVGLQPLGCLEWAGCFQTGPSNFKTEDSNWPSSPNYFGNISGSFRGFSTDTRALQKPLTVEEAQEILKVSVEY